MFEYKFDDDREMCTLIQDGVSIDVSYTHIQNVYNAVVNRYYYKEDVLMEMKNRIDDGELPEEALNNNEYIKKVVTLYSDYRFDYDTMPWEDALSMAFDNVEYA